MKCFEYNYHIPYGSGCGVVFAETIEEAITMIKSDPYHKIEKDDLEVEEIDISKPIVIDHSYAE